MPKSYSIITTKDSRKLADYLKRNGQILLPMVNLLEASRMAVDELIDVLGRASIEAVLELSAEGVAGPKQRGRRGDEVQWYGSQAGKVRLSERKLRVRKPRLRRRGGGRGAEVAVPAYEAIKGGGFLGERILEILMCSVSTRAYEKVIPEMAETVGVSKSAVSREFVKVSGEKLKELAERRFEEMELVVIYIDGLVFGEHHVIAAVGVDSGGVKHVLGVGHGASENSASATSLLEDLVERGVDPSRRYLFVIDGSKALRKAINQVFGADNPVQRCRIHKIRNVCDKLPAEHAQQTRAEMKAAYQLPRKKGIARLKKRAEWLDIHYPDAAASLREGLEETFTINRLELPGTLRHCLGSTNIIESNFSGVRMRTRRVRRWRNAQMVLRWVSTAFLKAEENYHRIKGHRDLWTLQAKLRKGLRDDPVDAQEEVA